MKLLFICLTLMPSFCLSEPISFVDRYSEYEEPRQDEYNPYIECVYNMSYYFNDCWEMSKQSKSPAQDKKAVSCFKKELNKLLSKSPEILEGRSFCLFSHDLRSLSDGEINFNLRGIKFLNSPLNKVRVVSKDQKTMYRKNKNKALILSFTASSKLLFSLNYLGFCISTRCNFDFYITEKGELL